MKVFRYLVFALASFMSVACSEDDICTTGEASPRLKIKFKTQQSGKLKTLDSLYIAVDYGVGKQQQMLALKTDSVLVPLRLDRAPYTDLYFKTSKKGAESKVRIRYSTTSQYVSPACGIKILYHELMPEVLVPNPVLGIDKAQNEIVNENKTSLYLLF